MRLAPLALFLALAGCAGSTTWTREGVTQDQATRDYAQCRREADAVVQKDIDIDKDILATRSYDWQRSDIINTKRDVMQSQNRGRAGDILARCMQAKGYSPAKKE